jgi:peptide/nickel transport system permease protein
LQEGAAVIVLQTIGRRVVLLIPILFGVTLLSFLLLNLLPGDTATAILGTNATHQELAQLQQQLGLNQSLVVRYAHWLGGALTGNLSHSLITQQSVASLLAQDAPVTLELLILGFLIALVLAIPVAMLGVHKPGGIADRITALVAMVGLSVPNFIVGLVLILVFAVRFRIFPATGFTPLSDGLVANLRTMILPALSLSFALFATYVRMLRADMHDQLATEDYVVTARAKGLSEWVILGRHVLRNSLFGLLTVVAVNFGTFMGATVIIESIFALPGIGQLLVMSIENRDVTVVQGVVVVMAVVVVAANLVADLLYAVLDPRVRYGRPGT